MSKLYMKKELFLLVFLIFGWIAPVWTEDLGYAFKNKLGMKFAYIRPGSFVMGSPSSEKGRERDEKQHNVKISKGFYLAVTEVTQGQWYAVMENNPSAFKECGANCPVENVSWDMSQEFIEKLNVKERTDKYRLPTEAEWEYACRAGAQTAFANGDITFTQCERDPNLDKMAWYCGNSGLVNPVREKKSHPVAKKKPNAWRLYDMHGNVQEWCLDSCGWRNKWTGKVSVITDTYRDGVVDPLSTEGTHRVFRGGSWNQSARYSRAANRSRYQPMAVRNNIGLRVVKEL